jgi:hypothetical protein
VGRFDEQFGSAGRGNMVWKETRQEDCLRMRGEQFSTRCCCDSALSTPINLFFCDPIESKVMPNTTLSRF